MLVIVNAYLFYKWNRYVRGTRDRYVAKTASIISHAVCIISTATYYPYAAAVKPDLSTFYYVLGGILLCCFVINLKMLHDDGGDDWFSDSYKKTKKFLREASFGVRRRKLAYVSP